MLILDALKILFADLYVFFLSFDLCFPIGEAKKFLVRLYFRLLAELLEMDKSEVLFSSKWGINPITQCCVGRN